MLKAGNHAEDGRLAAARRAEEGDKFSVANGKVQGRDDGILFKFLGNAYQSDHLFHLCCVTTFLYQWIFARKALIWLKSAVMQIFKDVLPLYSIGGICTKIFAEKGRDF